MEHGRTGQNHILTMTEEEAELLVRDIHFVQDLLRDVDYRDPIENLRELLFVLGARNV